MDRCRPVVLWNYHADSHRIWDIEVIRLELVYPGFYIYRYDSGYYIHRLFAHDIYLPERSQLYLGQESDVS